MSDKLWQRPDGMLLRIMDGVAKPHDYTVVEQTDDGLVVPVDVLRSLPEPPESVQEHARGGAVVGGARHGPTVGNASDGAALKKELTATKGKLTRALKRIQALEADIAQLAAVPPASSADAGTPESDDLDGLPTGKELKGE